MLARMLDRLQSMSKTINFNLIISSPHAGIKEPEIVFNLHWTLRNVTKWQTWENVVT